MGCDRIVPARTTRQLAAVLATVATSGQEHPTAEQVFRRVRRTLPRISLGTVYRNLQRLVAEGRIGYASINDRVVRFDPTAARHDHFFCRHCGRIEDLHVPVPRRSFAAVRRAGHAVQTHAVVLEGRCRWCRTRRGALR